VTTVGKFLLYYMDLLEASAYEPRLDEDWIHSICERKVSQLVELHVAEISSRPIRHMARQGADRTAQHDGKTRRSSHEKEHPPGRA
jgi:hypothetical protein